MSDNVRLEYDAFQMLTQHVVHAIEAYLAGSHPLPVMHSTHAAHVILKDLASHAVKDGLVQDMQSFNFFTDLIDESARRLSFKRGKGKQEPSGYYHSIGNAIKHADRDNGNRLILITNQNAFEYLNAVVRDYQVLKTTLLETGAIKLYDEYENYQKPSWSSRLGGVLYRKFNSFAGFGFDYPDYPKPYVDIASDIFLDWVDRIEGKIKWLKREEYEFTPRYKLSFSQNFSVEHHIKRAISDVTINGLKKYYLYGEDIDTIRRKARDIIKEHMRHYSKLCIQDILKEIKYNHTWHGSGYAKIIDDRMPVEDIWEIDRHGYDYMP